MSNVLLRKMTFKSRIEFGIYPELTVQELINMNKHSELIKMYYGLEKIDFVDEVKEQLHITGDRLIPKPGKSWYMYYANISKMLQEIIDVSFKSNLDRIKIATKILRAKKVDNFYKKISVENKLNSKITNRRKVQFKKK